MTVSPIHVALLLFYAFIMAVGNLVLAKASSGIDFSGGIANIAQNALLNGYLWGGILLYGFALVFWLWLLSFIPLRYAYPVATTAILFAPLIAATMGGEIPSLKYWLGVVTVIVGLSAITSS